MVLIRVLELYRNEAIREACPPAGMFSESHCASFAGPIDQILAGYSLTGKLADW